MNVCWLLGEASLFEDCGKVLEGVAIEVPEKTKKRQSKEATVTVAGVTACFKLCRINGSISPGRYFSQYVQPLFGSVQKERFL